MSVEEQEVGAYDSIKLEVAVSSLDGPEGAKVGDLIVMRAERLRAIHARLDELEGAVVDVMAAWDALLSDRDSERALADRLAQRLQAWADDYVLEHDLDPGDLGGTYRVLAAHRAARSRDS